MRHTITLTVESDVNLDPEAAEDWLFDLIDSAVSNRIPGLAPLGYIEGDDGEDHPVTVRFAEGEIRPR